MLEGLQVGWEWQKTEEGRAHRSQKFLELWQDPEFAAKATACWDDQEFREQHHQKMVEWYKDLRDNRPDDYERMMERIQEKWRAWYDSLTDEEKQAWRTSLVQGLTGGPTRPHRLVHEALEPLGFVSEWPLGDFFLDEALVEKKICVEVNGCYWHGCEKCGFQAQGRVKERDAAKKQLLEQEGWTLVTIWEHDVHEIGIQELLEKLRAVF